MALRDKQARFVEEYILDLNATAAYKRAGYKVKNDNAAAASAAALLRNPKIAAAVAAAQAERSKRTQIDADYVLARLQIEAEGTGQDTRSADRIAAAKLIGQHVGMWQEKKTDETIPQWALELLKPPTVPSSAASAPTATATTRSATRGKSSPST